MNQLKMAPVEPTRETTEMDDEFYACQVCGHEGHADEFGKYCPRCGTDLDELETPLPEAAEVAE